MIIGIPKEIKNNEFRVGLTPAGARMLVRSGHRVFIQKGAGAGSGMADDEYTAAGTDLLDTIEDIYDRAEMIIKVKEPLPEEFPLLKDNQILFTYLHLAPAPDLTKALVKSNCAAVAYETVQLSDGSLPLLHPMSEVAGRIAPQAGAYYLEKAHGGRGILLGGVPGVSRGKVMIIGGGISGINACKIAAGLGADVTILDIRQKRLAYLDDIFGNTITTLMSNPENIATQVAKSDVVIGAVLIPGAKAPSLVSKEMISRMAKGSVVIDISIDQGGCFETSRPTTHQDPVYTVDDVIHYCVANIPGAVPRTSTFALTNVTLPYALAIADKGIRRAVLEDDALLKGVNVYRGNITYQGVADAMNDSCVSIETLLK
jgi:alanine dehydrogenase